MKKNILYTVFFTLLISMGACKKDTPQELNEESSSEVGQIIGLLSDTIVLNTTARMGTVDKTLLPKGCPTKYNFQWDKKRQKLKVQLPNFKVGKMPFAVAFQAYVTFSEVGYFKKDEYPPEDGWLQFSADDGITYAYQEGETEPPTTEGNAYIKGYVNPKTREIEYTINYNMMTVASHCFKQKIDKSRLKDYEKEFKQYEKDLKKYKEEHGIK